VWLKQNKHVGLAIATRGKKDFHAMTLPRHDIATRGVLAIATRGVIAIPTRGVLAIATRGVSAIATHVVVVIATRGVL